MKTFVRGSTVSLAVTFYDSDGIIVTTPDTATLTLSYVQNGCRTHTDYALTKQSDNTWTYDWDSTIAECGVVSGHAVTGGSSPFSSVDFEFRLTANIANRELAGDD